MSDFRSFRDAFSQRKALAADKLGSAPDKFADQPKEKTAKAGDAFLATGGSKAPKQGKRAGDAFAPEAKSKAQVSGGAQPKTGMTQPLTAGAAKTAKPKLPKSTPMKQPKMTMGKPGGKAALFAAAPFAQVRPQKMTAPLAPRPASEKSAKLTQTAFDPGAGRRDPFGRKDAKVQPQKALVPAGFAAPSSPMTKPAAKLGMPPVKVTSAKMTAAKPSAPASPMSKSDDPVRQAPLADLDPLVTPEEAKAEAARAPLQIVANKSVLDHTGFRKFRRAARSSSLVLISGAAADAIASADTLDAEVPEDVSAPLTDVEEPDTLLADKPVGTGPVESGPVEAGPIESGPLETAASPASPAPAAEAAAASTGGGGPKPPPTAETPPPIAAEPATPEPTPPPAPPAPEPVIEVAAEKPVEVIQATVEPESSVPYDTASEPVDQLATPKPPLGTPRAVETSWQAVAGGSAAEAQPAAAVLRKVETSPVAGYWDGATAGAKSALTRRGFNQDDVFGVAFGLMVLAFLLMFFLRGKGEETPGGDLLATPQSVTGQSLAALTPAPKVDPFGDAPVNLKPTGPIPNAAPGDPQIASIARPAATPAPAAPLAASPPALSANPEAAIPIAERKMHAWFCTASSRMTKSSRTELKGQMAKFEDVFAGKELIVRGYADTRGSTTLNADLGSRRAQTVADYLTAKGLSVVDVQGVGELDGLDDNQNCSNQRRVDVWVKGGPAETPSRECAPEPDVEALVCG